jgi:hypothetical protein
LKHFILKHCIKAPHIIPDFICKEAKKSYGQFYQHFTHGFCANNLAPKKPCIKYWWDRHYNVIFFCQNGPLSATNSGFAVQNNGTYRSQITRETWKIFPSKKMYYSSSLFTDYSFGRKFEAIISYFIHLQSKWRDRHHI